MIVALHVATGGLAGALLRSRRAAVAGGVALHVLGDAIPHRDFPSVRFELASGLAGVVGLGLRRGFADPVTVGAIASSVPDLEHLVPLRLLGGRKLFPSHRWPWLHHRGGISAGAQLAVSIAALAGLLAQPGR